MNEQFYNWLGQRIEDYEAARERGIKAHQTRLARVAAERNDGIEPNISSAGFHAPIEGYIWETDEGSNVYLKGQFLPWPEDEDHASRKLGAFSQDHTIRNVPVDRAEDFISHFNALPQVQKKLIGVGTGAYFEGDSGTLCYVYISKCPKDLIEAIEDYLMGDIYKLQRLAQEKTEQEIADRDAAHAEGEDVPEGRLVITGTLLAMKWQESYYGSTLKMLVQDDRGFRVWGSVPSSLDANRNDRIQFTAAVTQSDDDPKFGFFKRPSKATVLSSAAQAA
jgi:hypothetical protein